MFHVTQRWQILASEKFAPGTFSQLYGRDESKIYDFVLNRAPLHEMRNNASVYATNNQQFPPAASNSNLVEGVQPVSFSNPFDSRV